MDKLILNCVTYGQMAKTFLHPICRFLPTSLFLKYGDPSRRDHEVWRSNHCFRRKLFDSFWRSFYHSLPIWLLRGRPMGRWLFSAYLEEVFCNGSKHLRNIFEHSVYDKLKKIKHKTLILTGFLDVMIPSYLSYEIQNLLPNSEIRCWNFGTHFIHLEYPEEVSRELQEVLSCGK